MQIYLYYARLTYIHLQKRSVKKAKKVCNFKFKYSFSVLFLEGRTARYVRGSFAF